MMTSYPSALTIQPVTRPVNAEVVLPGSKSVTNRALLLAALARGQSVLTSALFSDDTAVMSDSLRRLGIAVEEHPTTSTFRVIGCGGRIPAGHATLFVGNSGTTARFLTAALALGHGEYILDGLPRMRERPMQPLLDALQQLGVDATSLAGTGCPPIRVRANGLRGGQVTLPGTLSSQYLSALLMIGPCTHDGLDITVVGELVSRPYIDMTIATMRAFGAEVHVSQDGRHFQIAGQQGYTGRSYVVEPDASAASYFFALAAVTGGRITVQHLGRQSSQGDLHFVDLLAAMGCRITMDEDTTTVEGPARLRGISADMNAISDTVPTLAAIAPLAKEPVRISNVAHIRHKETDRIHALVTELRRLGVTVEEYPDGLTIYPATTLRPAAIETYDDHRIAMSFAILGAVRPGITILNPACVAKTFPDFFTRLESVLAPARV